MGREFEAKRRLRTFRDAKRWPPTPPSRLVRRRTAPPRQRPFSTASTAWEQPRKMSRRPALQCTSAPGSGEHGQRSMAGVHLLGFNEEVLLKLSKLCDTPSSTN